MAKTSKKTASAGTKKTNVAQQENPATQGGPTPSADDASQLTIADLQVLAQAIDIASRRGAYGAAEMGDVGAVYKKLTGFLQLIAEQRRAQAPQVPGGE